MSVTTKMQRLLLRICYGIASCGSIGYLPAPGSCATILVGVPWVLLSAQIMRSTVGQVLLLSSITIGSYYILRAVLSRTLHTKDPQWIVLDEVIGFSWACVGWPLSSSGLIIAIVAFRFFDISKWGPIGWSERLPGAYGVLLDDIMAGLCTQLLMYLICG